MTAGLTRATTQITGSATGESTVRRGFRWAISNMVLAQESTRLKDARQSVKLIEMYEKIRCSYKKKQARSIQAGGKAEQRDA
jgi:hypothetical protein